MYLDHGIAVETTVTVDGDCDMSCEIFEGEIKVYFGHGDNMMQLYLDWPGLHRLVTVLDAAIRRVGQIPAGQPVRFMVSADERSRREHMPNYPHDDPDELLVSDVLAQDRPTT